jgi:hypothetical protein
MLLTAVPDDLHGRGIPPAQNARGFEISLDAAEPWGGGTVAGRVERRGSKRESHAITVVLRCDAAWLDVAPQLVGQKRFLRLDAYWDLRSRAFPIWLDEGVWAGAREIGNFMDANWQHFDFRIPPELPRAFEGTFVAFRWRVEARRKRLAGWVEASLPLLLRERRTIPVVRMETSPIGSWRLLEWKADAETGGRGAACSVDYELRRPEDMPLPGETREQELSRRLAS